MLVAEALTGSQAMLVAEALTGSHAMLICITCIMCNRIDNVDYYF